MPALKSMTLQLRICSVYLREDGIFSIEVVPNETFTLQDAHELRAAKVSLCGERPVPNLFMLHQFSIPDHEARAFAASPESLKYRKAEAIVIQSFSQKMVANFYLRFNKPVVPTRVFNQVAPALEWLKKYV
jgi:hypothetical protein